MKNPVQAGFFHIWKKPDISCSMKRKFWKAHSCGNDFIIVKNWIPDSEQIRMLCDRHRGIGADGVLCLEAVPLALKVFNQDASSAKMCGNGLRCAMLIARKLRLANKKAEIQTDGGKIWVEETGRDPFACGFELSAQRKGELWQISDTLHYVLETKPDEETAQRIQRQYDCNVDFVKYQSAARIQVETFERGAGWTEACGTGACAAVMALHEKKKLQDSVFVFFKEEAVFCMVKPGWIWTEGCARLVYEGVIELED